MFLGRVGEFLCGELLKSADHAETGVARLDDIINVAVACSIVGVAEQFVVLFFFSLSTF